MLPPQYLHYAAAAAAAKHTPIHLHTGAAATITTNALVHGGAALKCSREPAVQAAPVGARMPQ